MANKRRKVDKYSRLKPKVNPLTYVGIGIFFLIIVLTIFLATDSASTKFLKSYQAGARLVQEEGFVLELDKNHSYEKVSLKKLKNIIKKEENVLVLFGTPNSPVTTITVDKVQKAYDQVGYYEGNNTVNNYISKIYYVELNTTQDEEGKTQFVLDGLKEFFQEHELVGYNTAPNLVAFKNGEVALQYEELKLDNLGVEATVIRSVDNFFKAITVEFSS